MTLFSKIIAKQIPSYKIAENNLFYAFLDIAPLQKGHTLVVPKIEIDNFFDLDENYLNEILVFAKPIAKAIEQTFNCNRVSIVTVGLEVPHAHLHLIPLNKANDISFSNSKLKLTNEEFIEIQKGIIEKLK